MDRRKFLKRSSATAAALPLFTIVPRRVLGGAGYTAPSEVMNLAIVGAGGRGRQVLKEMMKEPDVRVVAVADPARSFSLQDFYYRDVGGREPTIGDVERQYQAGDSGFKCKGYEDFREMLEVQSDIDGIICGTPDHLHAFVSVAALEHGKHVYCEKPLTHNIWEARLVAKVAAQAGLATQMGNQGHSTDGIRTTCDWIWAGAIGEVHSVKTWVSGQRWNHTLTGRPTKREAIPDGVNWDLWMGPRDTIPFSKAYFPVAWRDFWAFGNSNIGDFGCHDIDAACWALDLKDPTKIDFSPAGICNDEIGPHGCIGYYHFAATDKRPAVELTWYDGGVKPNRPDGWPEGKPLPGRGVLFEGDEGIIFCAGAGGAPTLLGKKADSFKPPAPTLTRVANHARDWLDACRSGGQAASNFQYGANLTEIALLGALSLRTRNPVQWNADTMTAEGLDSAAKIVKESYRSDWLIKGPV